MFTDPFLEFLDNASQNDVFAVPLDFHWDVRYVALDHGEASVDLYHSHNLPQNGSSAAWTETQASLNDGTSLATTDSTPSTWTTAPPASSSDTLGQQPLESPDSDATSAQIVGYVQHEVGSSGFVFKCSMSACRHTDFGRWPELKRHLEGFHAAHEVMWCPVSTCARSETFGDRPFPKNRADKLAEHKRNMHP
jgi:hypothetical protein